MSHRRTRLADYLVAAASLALVIAFPDRADFTGKVVAVADGDSITVLRDRTQVTVRLVEIDAPEKTQPFGNRSKQALTSLVRWEEVLVVERGQEIEAEARDGKRGLWRDPEQVPPWDWRKARR